MSSTIQVHQGETRQFTVYLHHASSGLKRSVLYIVSSLPRLRFMNITDLSDIHQEGKRENSLWYFAMGKWTTGVVPCHFRFS